MGENMKKILIIFAIVLMPAFAYGACTTMTTSPNTSYTSETNISWASGCSNGTPVKKYLVDTVKKTYVSVEVCNSCASGYTAETSVVYAGDCAFDVSFCSYCTASDTKPSTGSQLGSNNLVNAGCKTITKKYYYYSAANGYFTFQSCSECENGYVLNTVPVPVTSFGNCGTMYAYQCSRSVCNAGYYGSGGDDCTECPNKTDAYTSSSLSKNPSRRDGYIMSDRGSTTVDDCYLKDGTYYDATGAWTHGATCFYDGTSGGTVTDKCATVSYACLSYTGTANTAVSAKPNSSSGAACWCTANNKSIYLSTMGPSVAPTYTANCENACPSACVSNVASNPTWRTALGCDS